MSGEIVLREYQKSDRGELVDIIRKTWNYDRFCSPKVAQKMARVYPVSYTHLTLPTTWPV